MDVIVALKQVPDPTQGYGLRQGAVTSPFDEWALEEALLLKETVGAAVTVVGLDEPGIEGALYRATALGATRTVKLTGVGDGWIGSQRRAQILASWIRTQPYDLVLSGVQAPDDLDGQLPGLLAARLGHPYASVVVGVEPGDASVIVTQEFGGGGLNRLEIPFPAVLGIQASLRDPRYVSEMRVRLAGMGGGLQEVPADLPAPGAGVGLSIRRTFSPPASKRAAMLPGGAGETADAILGLLRTRGLIV
jgi:electron transfer flavoprotein beta subunit